MTISNRLDAYLSKNHIPYEAVPHYHTNSSIGSAVAAHVPIEKIAKAVMLADHEGRKMMAVLPANNKISLSAINDEFRGSYQLVKEQQVYQLFEDCEHGAIPPVGDAYNLTVICDELLDRLDDVYIEAGDHKTLLKIAHDDFENLMANGKHMRFSRTIFH